MTLNNSCSLTARLSTNPTHMDFALPPPSLPRKRSHASSCWEGFKKAGTVNESGSEDVVRFESRGSAYYAEKRGPPSFSCYYESQFSQFHQQSAQVHLWFRRPVGQAMRAGAPDLDFGCYTKTEFFLGILRCQTETSRKKVGMSLRKR